MLTIADKGGWGQKNFQQWELRGSKIVDSEKNLCKFYLKHWAEPNYMQIGPQQMNITHDVISKSQIASFDICRINLFRLRAFFICCIVHVFTTLTSDDTLNSEVIDIQSLCCPSKLFRCTNY